MEQQIAFEDVEESLSNQIAALSKSAAYNHAIIKQKDKQIEKLQQELDKLKSEHVAQLDKEVD